MYRILECPVNEHSDGDGLAAGQAHGRDGVTHGSAAGQYVVDNEHTLPGFEAVREVAKEFLGKQAQIPPAVSARKVGGQRLYRLARQGRFVEAPASEIEVFRFDLLEGAEDGRIRFRAEVSTGTSSCHSRSASWAE